MGECIWEQVQKGNYFALNKNYKPEYHSAMLNPQLSVWSSCKALANLAATVLLLTKHTDCTIDGLNVNTSVQLNNSKLHQLCGNSALV